MQNICRHIGLHSGAEQINDMTDPERCSLFELIKLLRIKNAKISGRKADLCER